MSIEHITVGENRYRVDFDYQPPERQTRDYPGCEANIDINEITPDADEHDQEIILDRLYSMAKAKEREKAMYKPSAWFKYGECA